MRYFGSFFITLFLYASTITTFFYSFNTFSITPKQVAKEKKSIVKISLINRQIEEKKVVKTTKIEPKKIEKKLVKTIKEARKKKITKIKKVTKKQDKKDITKVKKEIIKNEEKSTKQVKSNTKENKPISLPKKIDIDSIKNNYILKVKRTINNNKFYPNNARRRGIEGSVKVQFTIQDNGELTMVKIIQGKKIFFKAAKKAITDSFPIHGYKNNKIFPINLTLVLKYNLK